MLWKDRELKRTTRESIRLLRRTGLDLLEKREAEIQRGDAVPEDILTQVCRYKGQFHREEVSVSAVTIFVGILPLISTSNASSILYSVPVVGCSIARQNETKFAGFASNTRAMFVASQFSVVLVACQLGGLSFPHIHQERGVSHPFPIDTPLLPSPLSQVQHWSERIIWASCLHTHFLTWDILRE